MSPIDISAIDDKITWRPTSAFFVVVRKPDGDSALAVHCTQAGSDQWMVTKSVITSGGFDVVKHALSNQELIGMFDDLREALGAGETVARKWLADPVLDGK